MTPIFTVSWAMAPPAQARPRPSATAAAVLAVMRTSSLLSPRESGPAALCRPRLHTPAASRQEGCGARLTSPAARRQARGQRPAPRRVAHGRIREVSVMARKSLEQLLRETPSTVEMLRNSQIGAYVYPVVPNEFTSWRDEQRAWRETVVLFDQSHHMAELMVEGPDAFAMLQGLAPNSFGKLPGEPGQALRAVQPFRARDRRRHPVPAGGAAVPDRGAGADDQLGRVPRPDRRLGRERSTATTARRRGRGRGRWCGGATATRSRGRTRRELLEKLNGGPVPEIRFFHMGEIGIGGRKVRALRHGMSGRAGARDLGAVRGGRGDPRHHPRGGARVRAAAGGLAGLFDQHAGVGLDPVAAAGGLHRRGDEGLSRVAAGRRLRGRRLDRRQLRVRATSRTTT